MPKFSNFSNSMEALAACDEMFGASRKSIYTMPFLLRKTVHTGRLVNMLALGIFAALPCSAAEPPLPQIEDLYRTMHRRM